MSHNRREFMQNSGLAALALGLLGPEGVLAQEQPEKTKTVIHPSILNQEVKASPTLAEAAEVYIKNCLPGQQDPEKITILYPGSGWDISPLGFGLQLLHRTGIQRANYIHTEIGGLDYAAFANSWPESLDNLVKKTEEGLRSLDRSRVLQKGTKRVLKSSHNWEIPELPSTVIEYSFKVKTPQGPKELTLTLNYNNFDYRDEPTEKEREFLTPAVLEKARSDEYWPKKTQPGKVYPAYFNRDQFDQADVILSKQCGAFGLLQFDYLRALFRTQEPKRQRAILTEHATTRLGEVQESIRRFNSRKYPISVPECVPGGCLLTEVNLQYKTEVFQLENNDYGYCQGHDDCKVGLLRITPQISPL